MKIAIIYISKHGTTRSVANIIAKRINKQDTIGIDLNQTPNPNIEIYDHIILGTAIYGGKSLTPMQSFCEKNMDILKQKSIGLFICGMEPDLNRQEQELENAYPAPLLSHAKVKAFLGGEFLFDQMNFFERLIVKYIAKVKTKENIHKIDIEKIEEFVANM